jgi:cytochrome c-type biogenesis protein CcmE
MVLQFELVDGEETLPVTYAGIQPDAFRDGAQALVEGRYLESGVFEASQLLFECPSKYEAPVSTHEP